MDSDKHVLKKDLAHRWAVVLTAVALFYGCLLMGSERAYGQEDNRKTFTDQALTRAVESALALDQNVPSHLIDVRTKQGIVTIIGIMPHYRAKERAGNVVETIKGVQSVINGLTVHVTKRADEEIAQKVKQALSNDAATDSYDVKVHVDHGVVTLTGMVPSWAARDLSQWVAAGVYGVRDIKNQLRLDLKNQRNDQVILDEIQKRLESDVWVNEDLLLVTVNNGVVKLDGIVGSIAEKRRVKRDAHIAGVKEVDDQLVFVKPWAKGKMQRKGQPGYKTDDEIRETLVLAYTYDPRVSVFNPMIEVRHGMVTLTGVVDNLMAKRAAEEVAKHTRGVLWVKNFLKVRPKTPKVDKDLHRTIELALHDAPFLNRFQIQTAIHGGMVELRGSVESQFQKNRAEEVVSGVKGVVSVKNKLTVDETWVWKPDTVIQHDIESELWWSPFVDSEDVTVAVKAGVATLTGTVDSYFERQTAIENAHEGGARQVESLLTIRKYLNFNLFQDRPF